MTLPSTITDKHLATLTGLITASGGTYDLLEVYTGETIIKLPQSSPDDVAKAFDKARVAQHAWAALPLSGRLAVMKRFHALMLDNYETVVDLMQAETGKVRADAELEAPFIAGVINFYGENAESFLAEETPRAYMPMMRVKKLRTVLRPHPVVGNISPWNFPLILAFDDSIAALMAGAAVVIKPSEFTPLITMEIVRAL